MCIIMWRCISIWFFASSSTTSCKAITFASPCAIFILLIIASSLASDVFMSAITLFMSMVALVGGVAWLPRVAECCAVSGEKNKRPVNIAMGTVSWNSRIRHLHQTDNQSEGKSDARQGRRDRHGKRAWNESGSDRSRNLVIQDSSWHRPCTMIIQGVEWSCVTRWVRDELC